MNFKEKSVLIYDNSGFYTGFAELCSRHFGSTGYFYPWEHFYADGRELVVGYGLPGVERVKFLEKDLARWDLIVFTSAQDGYYQQDLRNKGHRVFGSGLGAEVELLRWKSKGIFNEAKISMPECHRVSGISELRDFFRNNPRDEKWYVKVSELRGLGDTWGARNYAEAKGQIDEWESRYSPQCYLMHYIIEAAIPNCKELGYDGLSIDGQFPEKCMYGEERKDKSYFGRVADYASIPKELINVNDSLSPTLQALQYRNFFATELRDESPIDTTGRQSSPAGEVVTENIDNLAEVIWFGAEGKLVQPVWKYQFGAQLVFTSDWAWEHRVIIDFPEEVRPFLKLYNHARVEAGDGIGVKDQFVPQVMKMRQLGSVIALADDPKEAIDLCKERASSVNAFDLEFDCDALDEAYEEMESVNSDGQ